MLLRLYLGSESLGNVSIYPVTKADRRVVGVQRQTSFLSHWNTYHWIILICFVVLSCLHPSPSLVGFVKYVYRKVERNKKQILLLLFTWRSTTSWLLSYWCCYHLYTFDYCLTALSSHSLYVHLLLCLCGCCDCISTLSLQVNASSLVLSVDTFRCTHHAHKYIANCHVMLFESCTYIY